MFKEIPGKTEINITHEISSVEGLKKVNRLEDFNFNNKYLGAIVEIRCENKAIGAK